MAMFVLKPPFHAVCGLSVAAVCGPVKLGVAAAHAHSLQLTGALTLW